MTAVTLRELNRTTLHRQHLLERATGTVAGVVGNLAGLQAQHSTWPHVALWTRRHTAARDDLERALTDRSVVKATSMRTTLHIIAATDARALDVMSAPPRLATWRPSATRAGLDLLELNAEVRVFCRQPRTVAEIEACLSERYPTVDPGRHVPGGVRNAWFRLATAGGGLVHTPPSGFLAEHGKPRYVDIDVWLDGTTASSEAGASDQPDALRTGITRFLTAYGPATLADLMQWSGERRVGVMRKAVKSLGDRIAEFDGPDGETILDLAGLDLVVADAAAPPRFLARWDSLLVAYAPPARARLVDAERTPAIYKKNGDILPTFLIDGMVAGLWSTETIKNGTVLRIDPFTPVPAKDRAALTSEADRLLEYLAPDTEVREVVWTT